MSRCHSVVSTKFEDERRVEAYSEPSVQRRADRDRENEPIVGACHTQFIIMTRSFVDVAVAVRTVRLVQRKISLRCLKPEQRARYCTQQALRYRYVPKYTTTTRKFEAVAGFSSCYVAHDVCKASMASACSASAITWTTDLGFTKDLREASAKYLNSPVGQLVL